MTTENFVGFGSGNPEKSITIIPIKDRERERDSFGQLDFVHKAWQEPQMFEEKKSSNMQVNLSSKSLKKA